MAQQPESSSFTTSSQTLKTVLANEVAIAPAYAPGNPPQGLKWCDYVAIWDTGATGSVISERVVIDCNLKQIGITRVNTAGGVRDQPVYLVNIRLQNGVEVTHVKVSQASLGPDTDVLIGMNIITRGDFAVTNYMGKTAFSFRVPSIEKIDFVAQARRSAQATGSSPKVGRNDPCPCGSGKKYKTCHGK